MNYKIMENLGSQAGTPMPPVAKISLINFLQCESNLSRNFDTKSNIIRHVIRTMQCLSAQKRGFTLIEVLISIALLATLGIALLQGLSTMALGQGVHDERVGSLIAAQTHLESIKQAPYDSSVTATPGPGYSSLPVQSTVGNIVFDMQIIAQQLETGVQLVTVVVSHSDREINRLQTYKVDR